MTFTETADAMRRVADAIDKTCASQRSNPETGHRMPMLRDDAAIGAAVMLCYLRDLITTGGKEVYDRPTLLVVLETISRDPELFPFGTGTMMWDAEDEADEEPSGAIPPFG